MKDDQDFENLIKDIQRKIEKEEESIYSKKVVDEYRNPVNFGIIENPDSQGVFKGPCGDTMKIYLKIKNQKITDASFWTDGCGASIAAGNLLTKMIIGLNLKKAEKITDKQLLKALDGLPEDHEHCSELAVTTLYKALDAFHKSSSHKKMN